MAKTLARMRRDGLVRDEPDPADGRRIRGSDTKRAWMLDTLARFASR
jgi:DNA-binding MarR family transcriptional regulator